MNETLMVVFTGVIAISTIVYCFFSYRLWNATRASVFVARYSAFSTLLMQLTAYIEEAKRRALPEAVILEQMIVIMSEFGFESFLKELNISKDKDAHNYFGKIEGLLRAHNIDPASVPWMRPVLKELKK